MNATARVGFRVSGVSMSTIEGSELYSSPQRYDGGTQGAKDIHMALHTARRSRRGKGWSYFLTTTREGAQTLENYCRTVGETFAGETEPETRAEGRALLATADQITKALARP